MQGTTISAAGQMEQDYCDNARNVEEFYCKSNGSVGSYGFSCAGGEVCSEGKCMPRGQQAFSCNDTDGGDNMLIAGTLRTSTGFVVSDECNGNGELLEFYCGEQSYSTNVHECPQGTECSDGACVISGQQAAGTSCTDSDGGQDLQVKGTATASNGMLSGTDY
ncbi:MAG: hypothetical protein V1822_00130 [Candidatus Micrarchaeota archaeon]